MDELEKQLKNRRADLDDCEPIAISPIWSAIDERLDGASSFKRRRQFLFWAAATVLLILSVSYFMLPVNPAEVVTDSLTLADISPELAEQELSYRKLIAEKEERLQLASIDQTTYGYFFEEFHLMDSLQSEYLSDLPYYGKNERLINTLLQYYELKLQLLEQLENELEKQSNYENASFFQEI